MFSRSPRVAACVLAIGLSAMPAVAAAHAELVSSTPADGSVLTSVPGEVVLIFSEELDNHGSQFTVTVDGDEVGIGTVDLTVAERNVMRGPITGDEVGGYTVSWIAVASDGHAEEGTITFVVGEIGDAAVGDQRLAQSLTRSGALLVLLGLLLAGTGLVRRRRGA